MLIRLSGIDIGTSFIKVSVVDAHSGQVVVSAQCPETEAEIIRPHPGWAEQSPDLWWQNTIKAIAKLNKSRAYDPKEIKAIGISCQMYGLVITL